MRISSCVLPALILALTAAPASADKLTLGSDLRADASVTEAHQADTAFWATSIAGRSAAVPEDGQLLSIKVKGTVLKDGSIDPLNDVHFQSLDAPQGDGTQKVWLTSAAASIPVGQPNTISTFTPENLCIHKGGSVAFNDEGGWAWGGSYTAPLDYAHYKQGAPFVVFGAAPGSSTAQFSKNNGTMNGAILDPVSSEGAVRQGQELLMQYVLATGDDRSQACGGPRRHPDGVLVRTTQAPAMHVIVPQRAYVPKTRSFKVAFYCAARGACSGTASILYKGRVLAKAPFTAQAASSGRVFLRLTQKDYRALDTAKRNERLVKMILADPSRGTFSGAIKIGH